ncbi:hypothetical protein N8I77_000257 [Diaporthe amygdali]|uniref:DUF4470 domain-containing protein n=1 Tax=Phomopsis amygdali TaxID=1214568 RepID=A0AAD9W9N1_PHOAM|nr:hypothetical protein N8I77_000257 [Diaporthe amygdali]
MATETRERGNTLYKQGKLLEAIKCYEEAASLSPEDPAPSSNLSAAKFEIGKYLEAADHAQKALSLSADESPSRNKLNLRLARCHLYGLQTQKARAALDNCGDFPGKGSIVESLAVIDNVKRTGTDPQRLRRDVLDRLPRYKPCLQDEPEYYTIGHDEAESQFDSGLAAKANGNSFLSFLFCGIGDARHLLSTLPQIMLHSSGGAELLPKELHFTLVDLKPAALARILILLRLLSQLPPYEDMTSPAVEDVTCVISYLYIGHVMPPFVYKAVSRVIQDLIRVLEENRAKDPMLKWTVMPETTRVQVLEHLRYWSKPLDNLYRPENIRHLVKTNIKGTKMSRMRNGLSTEGPTPLTCEEDEAAFDAFTITPPPAAFIKRHEPEIGTLLDLMRSATRKPQERARHSAALDEYINRHWKTNMTLIDFAWEARKDRNNDQEAQFLPEWARLTAMEGEHVSMLRHILGDYNPSPLPGQKGVIQMLGTYFFLVAKSLEHIRRFSNLRVEIISGEMTDVMERLRYGCVEGRAVTRFSASFPQRFDRIHMSNVPDYIGGILGPLKYARPLLKDRDSNFQYRCLLNPPRFKSQEHFLSEYVLLSDEQEIRDHFCAELFDQYDGQVSRPSGKDFYLGQGYWAWKPSGDTSKLPWKKLMPRPRLERWLYAHFLKICLPAKRDPEHGAAVYAPLNLTAFIRLLLHLFERGYPAHWLGTVIENLTSASIKTTARAPRKEVMDVEDVNTVYPLRQISVAP